MRSNEKIYHIVCHHFLFDIFAIKNNGHHSNTRVVKNNLVLLCSQQKLSIWHTSQTRQLIVAFIIFGAIGKP
jgi:hypothetical protein